MNRWFAIAALAFLLANDGQAAGETVAIVGAKILTGDGEAMEPGTVVFAGGKITSVTQGGAAPAGARVVDGKGLTVAPGFIESGTNLGLVEIDQVPATHDEDEATSPVTPQVRVVDGFHPGSKLIAVARINGVTSALVSPGDGNVFTGQSALVHLDGWTLPEMLVKAPVAMHMGFGEPPKARYGERKTQPSTRMGIAATVRETFEKALAYKRKKDDFEKKSKEKKDKDKPPSPPDVDMKSEALLPVLSGALPVIARAQRMDDILTAIRLSEEFHFRLILSRAAEAYKVAATLAAKKIPVIVGPIGTQPDAIEEQGAIYENAALLAKAGVTVAIESNDTQNVRNLPFQAGLAVRYGMPYAAALSAITSVPARLFGVEAQMGRVASGCSADLAVFEGDPLEPRSKVRFVFIAGREIPLRSYQTDLYDQYRQRP